MASNDPWRIEEEKLPLSAEWKRSRGGNIWPRTLTFLLDTRGNVPNPLANIQRYRLYTEREREGERASFRLEPMWADVSMKLYPPPDKEDFHFLCVRNANHAHAYGAWNDRRPSRFATGLFWRELIADRREREGRESIIDLAPPRGFSFVSLGIGYGIDRR